MNALEIAFLAAALKSGKHGDKKYFCAFGAEPIHDLAKRAAAEGLLVEILHPEGGSYMWPRYIFPSQQPQT